MYFISILKLFINVIYFYICIFIYIFVLEILNKNFPNQNVDKALNDLCNLLQIDKEQIIECPKCKADQTKQSCVGKWDNGIEYRCDECNHEHEIRHFD